MNHFFFFWPLFREVEALMLIKNFPDLVHIRNISERQTPLFYATSSIRRSIKGAFKNQKIGFEHIFGNPEFSDMSFMIETSGRSIKAHQCIVLFRWPKITNLPFDQKKKKYIVQKVESATFMSFLKYLYTDKLSYDHTSDLPKIIKAAEEFDVPRLKVKFPIPVPSSFYFLIKI